MKLSTTVKCPYCGNDVTVWADEDWGKMIELCEKEFGGCDYWFAVFYRAILDARSFAIGTEDERNRDKGVGWYG